MIKALLAIMLLYTTGTNNMVQQPQTLPYTRQIARHNLLPLWRGTRLNYPDSNAQWAQFPEPLGFIGKNYQRFYIHYTSINKDAKNPYRYHVKGKTRVKNHICEFTGTITIVKAFIYEDKNKESPEYSEGKVECTVDFWENKRQQASGHIRGKLISNWYLDKKGQIQYNILDGGSDGFDNNQCTATWTSYYEGTTKTCNFRIPESGNLDIGAGEFYVNEKYISSGWQHYNLLTGEKGNEKVRLAIAEEEHKWWQ
jgi:hypothetical protein